MDATRVLTFAVGVLEISLSSWAIVTSHYMLRPSSFDFIFKRRDRIHEWRTEMDDLPRTFICITSPFLLLGHIGMGIVDIIMFLPWMVAFLLLHIIAATCFWCLMPCGLRPVRCTFICLQASCSAGRILLAGFTQFLSTVCTFGKAKHSALQYHLQQFAPLESEYNLALMSYHVLLSYVHCSVA